MGCSRKASTVIYTYTLQATAAYDPHFEGAGSEFLGAKRHSCKNMFDHINFLPFFVP